MIEIAQRKVSFANEIKRLRNCLATILGANDQSSHFSGRFERIQSAVNDAFSGISSLITINDEMYNFASQALERLEASAPSSGETATVAIGPQDEVSACFADALLKMRGSLAAIETQKTLLSREYGPLREHGVIQQSIDDINHQIDALRAEGLRLYRLMCRMSRERDAAVRDPDEMRARMLPKESLEPARNSSPSSQKEVMYSFAQSLVEIRRSLKTLITIPDRSDTEHQRASIQEHIDKIRKELDSIQEIPLEIYKQPYSPEEPSESQNEFQRIFGYFPQQEELPTGSMLETCLHAITRLYDVNASDLSVEIVDEPNQRNFKVTSILVRCDAPSGRIGPGDGIAAFGDCLQTTVFNLLREIRLRVAGAHTQAQEALNVINHSANRASKSSDIF